MIQNSYKYILEAIFSDSMPEGGLFGVEGGDGENLWSETPPTPSYSKDLWETRLSLNKVGDFTRQTLLESDEYNPEISFFQGFFQMKEDACSGFHVENTRSRIDNVVLYFKDDLDNRTMFSIVYREPVYDGGTLVTKGGWKIKDAALRIWWGITLV